MRALIEIKLDLKQTKSWKVMTFQSYLLVSTIFSVSLLKGLVEDSKMVFFLNIFYYYH